MSSSHTRQSSLPRSLAAPLCHPRMLIAHSRVSRLDFFFFSFVCQSFLINFLHPQLVCNHLIKNLKLLTITLLSRLSGVALSLSSYRCCRHCSSSSFVAFAAAGRKLPPCRCSALSRSLAVQMNMF